MAYYECVNETCRVAIFIPRPGVVQCPCCWRGGRRLDTATLDELLLALDKTIPTEQLRMVI